MTIAGGKHENCTQASAVRGRGCCNLDLLRTCGPDALRPDIPEILKIRLTEIEIAWEDAHNHVEILRADDLLGCHNTDHSLPTLIPYSGRVTRAIFAVHLADSSGPTTVEISADEPLDLPAGSHTEFLRRWLTQSGFCE